ncbi:MAG: phosphoribosylanthranilate isomerase [bacterium]
MTCIKIKICGITLQEDAKFISELGAWALGFIFVKNSPRYIKPDKAAKIIKTLPQNIEKIGVFANSSLDEIREISLKTGITKIQLHGDESKEFCLNIFNNLNIPVIKAIRVKNIDDILTIKDYKDIVFAVLLDSYSESQLGGTGKSFCWDIASKAKLFNIPIILAGGLNSDNIEEACLKVQPYALDISSGVEKYKGIKDHAKLKKIFSLIWSF